MQGMPIVKDLTWQPSFYLHLTRIQTRPWYCQDKHSDQGSSWLCHHCDFYIDNRVLLRFDMVTKVLDTRFTDSNLGLLLSRHILTKYHQHWVKHVAYIVLTWFFSDLIWWPGFWMQLKQIQPWYKHCQDKHNDQVSSRLRWNFGVESGNSVFFLWFC